MEAPPDFYHSILEQLDEGVYFVDTERRITFWNGGAERISGYAADTVVGTKCSDNLLMHVDESGTSLCLEGCPLAATMLDAQCRRAQVFLHHRQGHRVPVEVRATPLKDHHGNIIGGIETFTDNSTKIAAIEHIRELESVAFIDELTGIANRRYTQTTLEARFAESSRYDWDFGVIMADVDHFKNFNDQHGHDVGDKVLQMVARTFSANLRPFDLVGRWGGEEFVLILPNVSEQDLGKIGESMRALIENCSLTVGSKVLKVTISAGAAVVLPDDRPDGLMKRADELLYKSKEAGRNRVSVTPAGGGRLVTSVSSPLGGRADGA